jgi:hypothetical protein
MACKHCGRQGDDVCSRCRATGHSNVAVPLLECPACIKRRAELRPGDGCVFIGGAYCWPAG